MARKSSKSPRNLWRRPAEIDSERRRQLTEFITAVAAGDKAVDCLKRAFGDDVSRKSIFSLFAAALQLGILKVQVHLEEELGQQMRARFDVRAHVVNVDTHFLSGRLLLALRAWDVILRVLKELCEETSNDQDIYFAVAGGDSVHSIITALEQAETKIPEEHRVWLSRSHERLHVVAPTVGHLSEGWERAAQNHVMAFARYLGIPPRHCQPLWGPCFFQDKEETKKYLEVHQSVIDADNPKIKLIIGSCGPPTENNYCYQVMNMQRASGGAGGDESRRNSFASTPNFSGEILFNLYDQYGAPIEHGMPLLTLFPGDEIPARVRANELRVIGIVYAATKEAVRPKAQALRGAIRSGQNRWFTDVVCTAEIARELLNSDGS